MPRLKITTRTLEALQKQAKAEAKAVFLWDTELKGFGARISGKGHVSWLAQKWIGGRGGKSSRVTIGQLPAMTLDEARQAATAAVGEAAKGNDIAHVKKEAKRRARVLVLSGKLSDVVETYLKRSYAEGQGYKEEVRRFFNFDVYPTIGKDTLVASITNDPAPNVPSLIMRVLGGYGPCGRLLQTRTA